MYSCWTRAGFSPSPPFTLLSHEGSREDGGRVIIIVSCGPHIAFAHPVSSAAAWRSDFIWCNLFCFKGFWKNNKVVELCGLITAHGLGGSEGYVRALRLLY